jgi:hypothetical protein
MGNYWLEKASKGLKTVDFNNLFESINDIFGDTAWDQHGIRQTYVWVEEADAILSPGCYRSTRYWGKVSVFQYKDKEYRIAFYRSNESEEKVEKGWLYHFDLTGKQTEKSIHSQYN